MLPRKTWIFFIALFSFKAFPILAFQFIAGRVKGMQQHQNQDH